MSNNFFVEPRFCAALDTNHGWEIELEIEDHKTRNLITILADYAHLPIRCKFCFDVQHKVSLYPHRLGAKPPKPSGEQPPNRGDNHKPGRNNIQTTQDQDKAFQRRPLIDNEGFILVGRGSRGMARVSPQNPALLVPPHPPEAPPYPTWENQATSRHLSALPSTPWLEGTSDPLS